jgi:hypothetical protein
MMKISEKVKISFLTKGLKSSRLDSKTEKYKLLKRSRSRKIWV